MYKNFLLLLTLLPFTGCAERGFNLTSHMQTRTATAESSTDIDVPNKELQKNQKKMKDAVKNKLIHQNNSIKNTQKPTKKEVIHISIVTKKEAIHISTLDKETRIPKPKITTSTAKPKTFNPKFTEDQLLSSSTEDLIFKSIKKTYQKFGNSEIHGHVIYLNTSGLEMRLENSIIYLLAVNQKLDNWYNNFYLKNNRQTSQGTQVNYLNHTYLNLSKNFAFHGIAPGEYFVIIVSDNPKKDKTNKKIYIAKKIKVEKRKKIMAVFSKKL
jgi:hypothetical protein